MIPSRKFKVEVEANDRKPHGDIPPWTDKEFEVMDGVAKVSVESDSKTAAKTSPSTSMVTTGHWVGQLLLPQHGGRKNTVSVSVGNT